MTLKKTCGYALTALLIINLILFPLGYIPMWSFWLTIIVVGLFAFYVLPKL